MKKSKPLAVSSGDARGFFDPLAPMIDEDFVQLIIK
jgi:hypothetical protein